MISKREADHSSFGAWPFQALMVIMIRDRNIRMDPMERA